ncbi:MAG TPA: polymer-forming cytoskeletal protein [Longimicrobiales bacterium]|nr:polymer-forming cytoskeletal protein [Longimicrobiales bacterium]
MRILTALLLVAVAVPAVAQEEEIRSANLPRELEWQLLRMFEGEARRIDGEATIGRTEVVTGGIAAHLGPLRIAGQVAGDVAMVGGDVVIEEGGSVTGSVTVVGGQVRLADGGRVGGTITSYALSTSRGSGARTRDRYDDRDDERDRRRRRDRWEDRGYSRLTLRAGSSYNRVEGLPVLFGPIIQTAGPNPLRLEALAIWRTEAGADLDTDRMGYQATIGQFLGGHRTVSVGASAFSLVEPLDRWQLSDLEASLATAVFHEDYRDYFDRTGWSAFVRATPRRSTEARLEYRNEDHTALAAGDPWSLFHGGEPWRLQPLIAEGDVQTILGTLTVDLRDDADDPGEGWFARVAVERPVSGSLTRPALTTMLPHGAQRFINQPVPAALAATPVDLDFTTGMVDLRRYTPVGYRSQLNLRLVAGGTLTARSLPPQFQHALGGLGTLPGFETFLADCGARSAAGTHDGDRYFPAYGCDRMALGQVEYRGSLSLDFGIGDPDWDEDDEWWEEVRVDLSPTWVVFLDAGRGWAYDEPAFGGDRDTGTLYDAGVGFLFGDVGIYVALPLNGGVDQEPRFFIRLGRRF